jgi:hypothetical protein
MTNEMYDWKDGSWATARLTLQTDSCEYEDVIKRRLHEKGETMKEDYCDE